MTDRRMTVFIALLRGVNVGGHKKIPMSEVHSLCAGMGWSDVRSYIQSGNLLFRAGAGMAGLLGGHPFPRASGLEPKLVMLALSKATPKPDTVKALQERATGDERIVRVGDALWVHYDGGVARSKLAPALLDRQVGSPVSTRNWRTVLKLDELAARVSAGP